MSCTFASAARTACGSENISVKLHLIPSFCSCSAAFNPSQVDAILINTRSRGILRSWLSFVFFSSATAVLIRNPPFGLDPKRTPRLNDRQSKNCFDSGLTPLPRHTRDSKSNSRHQKKHDSTDNQPDRG